MSTQATLSESVPTPDDDIGEWRLATEEPGFYSERRYWRTEGYVLVAHRTGFFAVYDVETWESGILGQENQPLDRERNLDDGLDAAVEWMHETDVSELGD